MKRLRSLAASAVMVLAAGPLAAQPTHGHPPPRGAPPLHFDNRYHHDHYYPRHGYVAPMLPGGAVSISFGGGSYYFHGGVWFRPTGPRFVVVAPPLGIVVPLLPPSYATLWIGGAPYYYANGVYYAPVPAEGYRVVPTPEGASAAKPAPVQSQKPAPEPILYPRNGQNPEQTEADHRECNRWATTQRDAMSDASVFRRAVEACLDGRGYTVR